MSPSAGPSIGGVAMDVHGAGAQRSDPKTGRASLGMGPQGDARRVQNYVRCVRGGRVAPQSESAGSKPSDPDRYPAKVTISDNLPGDSGAGQGERM